MLDVIADFWKPAKKVQAQEKLQPELLQVGSSLGFGFVPQAILSGRRLHVSAINTYQFGEETLTSFVLSTEKDATPGTTGISMIVAESDGEYYLAISRRVSLSDRMKLFDSSELEAAMTKPDVTRLSCRDNVVDFKGWLVTSYKREIQGLRGGLVKGDFRKAAVPGNRDAQEFEYTLLVSDSNEHAIEIEKYNDGRVEVYATVYRRLNDVGEITHPSPSENSRPDIKLASSSATPSKEPLPVSPVISTAGKTLEQPKTESQPVKLPEFSAPVNSGSQPLSAQPAAPATAETKPAAPEVKTASVVEVKTAIEPVKATIPQSAAPQPIAHQPVASRPVTPQPAAPIQSNPVQEKTPMSTQTPAINGVYNESNSGNAKLVVQSNLPENHTQQEIKAVSKATNSFDADAIECDLRVANKIIDEAIRNEMRLTDIVRRIIELPVANPESVQIPITLTDEDYALLAIRYGISSADRNAIKRRIIDDLNDFSGDKKKAA